MGKVCGGEWGVTSRGGLGGGGGSGSGLVGRLALEGWRRQ